jgi:hypothetical protein
MSENESPKEVVEDMFIGLHQVPLVLVKDYYEEISQHLEEQNKNPQVVEKLGKMRVELYPKKRIRIYSEEKIFKPRKQRERKYTLEEQKLKRKEYDQQEEVKRKKKQTEKARKIAIKALIQENKEKYLSLRELAKGSLVIDTEEDISHQEEPSPETSIVI